MKLFIDILGWVGSLEIVTAYCLNSYQKIASNSLLFLILNLTGGIFLAVYSFYYQALASTFINVIWVAIAIPGVVRQFKK